MLYRLVRPMKRAESSFPQFVQRIPADVKARAIGRILVIPLSDSEMVSIKITERTNTIRFSLRTRDPGEAKIRQARAAAQFETYWRGMRNSTPIFLTNREAHALAGEFYHAWADGRRERVIAADFPTDGSPPVFERPRELAPAEQQAGFAIAAQRLAATAGEDDLEAALGGLVDRLLLAKGIAEVDPECPPGAPRRFPHGAPGCLCPSRADGRWRLPAGPEG